MVTRHTGYRRILVAVDFSPHSDAALKQAVRLARETGAGVTLAHILPGSRRDVTSASTQAHLDVLYSELEIYQREMCRLADLRMRRMVADLGAIDLGVGFETFLGDAHVAITHAVQAVGYDLVLAGTRGLAAWEQFFVGSTAKRLIRTCPAAVWIVKGAHEGPPQAVLAATDFSDVSLKATAHGLWIAQQADAQFHLLHVLDSADVPEDILSTIPDGVSLRNEIDAEARTRLDAFISSLGCERDKIQVHLTWGTPWKEMQRLVEHLNVDLLAIGTIGRGGIKGLLLGNTAEKALNACDCSTLTVKPDDFVSPIQPAS